MEQESAEGGQCTIQPGWHSHSENSTSSRGMG